MYLKALEDGLFNVDSSVEFLSIDNLATVVNVSYAKSMFSYEICRPVLSTVQAKPASAVATSSNLSVVEQSTKVQKPVETQTIIDLPIVVQPIEAQTNIDLPIVVEPTEAQTIVDLPIVVEPVEAENNNQICKLWKRVSRSCDN